MDDPRQAHARLLLQLSTLGNKPPDSAPQATKKAYSERLSRVVASAVAKELRLRGLTGARPTESGLDDKSGAERRMAGGIGAKKVDVTWATEESGLLIAFSIKSINFRDQKTKNYQKNLTNRRGDLLFESITLHRRFPYAVLVGLFFFDAEAKQDGTVTRHSTFVNAHERLLLFKGRMDPAGRDEQYEHLYIGLLDASDDGSSLQCEFSRVGELNASITLDDVLDESLKTLVTRNSDLYISMGNQVVSSQGTKRGRRKGSDDDD